MFCRKGIVMLAEEDTLHTVRTPSPCRACGADAFPHEDYCLNCLFEVEQGCAISLYRVRAELERLKPAA
jgi:hypothetical protein